MFFYAELVCTSYLVRAQLGMIPDGIDESTDGKKPIISLALSEGGRSFPVVVPIAVNARCWAPIIS